MKFTIYKVTNKINGKFYIGKHQTLNENDSYLGSGKALRNAVKVYGRESFTKEILFIFETEEEMNAKEREIVTEEFISRHDTYNAGLGGEGGPLFKGRKHSDITKNKLREKRKLQPAASIDVRNKISQTHKGKVTSQETKNKISEVKKQLISIHNGLICRMIHKDAEIPSGWIRGKPYKKRISNSRWEVSYLSEPHKLT